MWAISFQILSKIKPKLVPSDFYFYFFSDPCLSRRWKTEQQKASRLKNLVWMQAWKPTQAVSKVFQDIIKKKKERKKKPYVEKSVFFFFFKCHSSRDYRPVLWAGSSLVFIIKWPSNRSSSSGSRPSTGGRSRLHASAPSRELLQSLWCIFQRGCDTTAKKTRDLHSSASIMCSEPLQQLLRSVDNLNLILFKALIPDVISRHFTDSETEKRLPGQKLHTE